MAVILGIVSLLMLFPMVWMFFTSFKTNADIRINRTSILPQEWTIDGYIKAFTEVPFLRWLFNSICVTGLVTIAVIITSTLLGFIFAKYEFKGKRWTFTPASRDHDGASAGHHDPTVSDRAEDGTLQYVGSAYRSYAGKRIRSISVQAVY